MTMPRKHVVLPQTNAVYHCISRCVRRAFLCGFDTLTEKGYEHRRKWIEDRISFLTRLFCIEIYSYAIMSNHFHVVLATDFKKAVALSDREIAKRWLELTAKQRNEDGNPIQATEMTVEALLGNPDVIHLYRSRLSDVSWFMRYINEWVARKANKEDDCKGRFWEGRFKCQRLEDRGAILTCMAYVDLNPVRAAIAETPETSEYTSVYQRIRSRQARENERASREIRAKRYQPKQISELFRENDEALKQGDCLSPIENIFEGIALDDYLELIDYTGRELREGKRGRIPPHLCGILHRLDLDHENWVESVSRYGSLFYYFAGKLEHLIEAMQRINREWCWGKRGSEQIYRSAS